MRPVNNGQLREAVAYVVVGVLTTVVSLGSYWLAVSTVLDASDALQLQIANVFSWICAVSFAYVTNRRFVFVSKDENLLAEAARFASARLSTLVIDMACMAILVSILGVNDKVAKIVVQFIVFALNYLFSKFLVFRKDKRIL